MKTARESIEELTLALLYLTAFPDGEGMRYDELAWKNYDFDAIDSLDNRELIINRKRAKSVYLTEQGREKAREILREIGFPDRELYERFDFHEIRPEEAEEAAEIEQICFPPNEACSREHMLERIKAAPELFLAATEKRSGKMAGFLNGIATNEERFRDEFFTDASLHKPDGKNVMLLGLDVLPEFRKLGLARELVFGYCRREQERGRKRLILTCHSRLVKMYRKFGFRDLGESASEWGGEKWHEMDIVTNL